jgi:sec-independent protein translocase protein TatA
MGGFSLVHWIIVILVVVLLFGAGRVSGLMGDVAKGIKSFKKGMADDEEAEPRRLASERTVEAQPAQPVPPPASATPATPVTPADPARPAEPDRNQA